MRPLFGKCAVCGALLDGVAYDQQKVCALLGPEGTIVFCADHVKDGRQSPDWQRVIGKVTLAKIAQLNRQ